LIEFEGLFQPSDRKLRLGPFVEKPDLCTSSVPGAAGGRGIEQPVDGAAGDTEMLGGGGRTHRARQALDLGRVYAGWPLYFPSLLALAMPSRWRSSMISRSQAATATNA
jgi:hypothetical protein